MKPTLPQFRWLVFAAMFVGGFLPAIGPEVFAADLHVWLDSPNPSPPFTTWATAATNLQQAVDAAQPGDTVWVTNGVYATGGRPARSTRLVNRVTVEKPILLRSVNGPQVTTITGAKETADPIRCVYLADGATISGFTLARGSARPRVLWDFPSVERDGGGVWAATVGALVTNCVLTGNSASSGGAAFGGTFDSCSFTLNSATYYGGGGAAYRSTLNHCTLTENSAMTFEANGGGALECKLRHCTLIGNRAYWRGGGADDSTLYSCILNANEADIGGGASRSTLYNCTLVGNWAVRGGGSSGCRIYNSIVYRNRAEFYDNYSPDSLKGMPPSTFEYSCTTPLPEGPGNLDVDPQLITVSHLSSASPCLGAGLRAYATGTDIDGDTWASPPPMGADQPGPGPASSSLTVGIEAPFRRTSPSGAPLSFVAHNTGQIETMVWDFGDGTMLTNRAFAAHAWADRGVYTVTLTGYSESFPDGVVSELPVAVTDAPAYVNPRSPHPVFPYASWETAATNIQDAIGSAALAGTRIWVTNGVYRTGLTRVARASHFNSRPVDILSRVALTNAVVLQSVNGPEVTVIEGGPDGPRCAYVGDGSVLSGFTLTGGTAASVSPGGLLDATDGGGAWCQTTNALITNCVLTGNSATGNGGGVEGGRLSNCRLIGNRAGGDGGGAFESDLFQCLVTGNSAAGYGGGVRGMEGGLFPGGNLVYGCTIIDNSASQEGGGVHTGRIYDSIVRGNRAPLGANYLWESWISPVTRVIEHSCVSPLPSGPGNLDADPRFVNDKAGDFRLRPDSPCIDAGTTAWDPGATDLLGNLRVLDGQGDGVARVDMGACEFDPATPFITRAELMPAGLRLEWWPAARGARLQRSARLPASDWEDVPGSAGSTAITLPRDDTTGFFRLVR